MRKGQKSGESHSEGRSVRKDNSGPAKDTFQSLPSGNIGLILEEASVASCLHGLKEQLVML